MTDPRHFQIAALGSLALYGATTLQLDLQLPQVAATFAAAWMTEALARRLRGEPFDPRSPMVTALSLTLLLRTSGPAGAACAAVLAIASKYVLRARGGHVFNPANFGIVVVLALGDFAWVSSGQWGHETLLGLALVGAGQFVIHRSSRSDMAWFFLLAWSALLFGRAAWLGDPWAIPWHQLQNGALLLFSFFMISDPRTTPRSRAARALYGVAVAGIAFAWQFLAYEPNGLLFALFLAAPAVPLLDRLLPGPVFLWSSSSKGAPHGSQTPLSLQPWPLLRG